MAKAPTRVAVTFEVKAAGKQNDLDGNPMNVVEHSAGLTGATVTVATGDSVLVCEDSTLKGIYTADSTGWVKQTRQPKPGDYVRVTGGTLYAGAMFACTAVDTFKVFNDGINAATAAAPA